MYAYIHTADPTCRDSFRSLMLQLEAKHYIYTVHTLNHQCTYTEVYTESSVYIHWSLQSSRPQLAAKHYIHTVHTLKRPTSSRLNTRRSLFTATFLMAKETSSFSCELCKQLGVSSCLILSLKDLFWQKRLTSFSFWVSLCHWKISFDKRDLRALAFGSLFVTERSLLTKETYEL